MPRPSVKSIRVQRTCRVPGKVPTPAHCSARPGPAWRHPTDIQIYTDRSGPCRALPDVREEQGGQGKARRRGARDKVDNSTAQITSPPRRRATARTPKHERGRAGQGRAGQGRARPGRWRLATGEGARRWGVAVCLSQGVSGTPLCCPWVHPPLFARKPAHGAGNTTQLRGGEGRAESVAE